MRILFYGGCHADALRRLFLQFGSDIEDVQAIKNFRLIRARQPVPYEEMTGFDWVVFSPILNKPGYNTAELEAFLKRRGIRFLRFPWLQWNGYFPGVAKKGPGWISGWWSSPLDQLAAESPSFDHFAGQVLDGTALGPLAVQQFEITTGWLRRLEQAADIAMTPFVVAKHQEERLFLTPDHPSTALYRHLVAEIARGIGCRLDPGFLHTRVEVQDGVQLPILPGVAEALGLRFRAGDYQHRFALGEDPLPLRDYLKLHFFQSEIRVAKARVNTRVSHFVPGFPTPSLLVRAGERVLLRRLPEKDARPHEVHELLAVISGREALRDLRGRAIRLYRRHWNFSVTQAVRDPDEMPEPAARQLAA